MPILVFSGGFWNSEHNDFYFLMIKDGKMIDGTMLKLEGTSAENEFDFSFTPSSDLLEVQIENSEDETIG